MASELPRFFKQLIYGQPTAAKPPFFILRQNQNILKFGSIALIFNLHPVSA